MERKKDLQTLKSMVGKQLRKTRFCSFYRKGICKYGSKCTFAHQEKELLSAPDLRKTRVCKAFLAGGCNDDTCNFAHGSEELRATEIFFKTHLCLWHERGRCTNGTRCRFAHGLEELRGGSGHEQQRPATAHQARVDDISSTSSSQEQDSSQAGSSGDAPCPGGGQQEFFDRRGKNMAQVASELSTAIAPRDLAKTLAEALASAGTPLPEVCRAATDVVGTFASVDSHPMKVQLAPQAPPQVPLMGFGAMQDGWPYTREGASKNLWPSNDDLGAINPNFFGLPRQQWSEGLAGWQAFPDAIPLQGQLRGGGPQEAYAHMIYALSNLSLQIQNLEWRT